MTRLLRTHIIWLVAGGLVAACDSPPPDSGPEPVDIATRSVTLSPNLHFPEEDPAVSAVEVNADEIVLSLSGELRAPLAEGDLVAGAAGEHGYLRAISAIARDRDRLVLTTRQGGLDEAIVDGAFELRFLDDGVVANPGVAPLTAATSVTLEVSDGPYTASVTGSLTADVDPSLRFDARPPSTREVVFTMPGTITGELRAEFTSSAGFAGEADRRFQIGRRPFYAQVGPLPVIGSVEYGVVVGANFEAAASVTLSKSISLAIPVSLDVVGNVGGEWTTSGSADTSGAAVRMTTLSAEGTVEAQVFVRPYVDVVFYGAAGLRTGVRGSFDLTGQASAGPSGTEACWRLDANLAAELYIDTVFVDDPLFSRTWPLATARVAESDPPCEAVEGCRLACTSAADCVQEAGVFAGTVWSANPDNWSCDMGACFPLGCRSADDCAEGFVCEHLDELGIRFCVAECATGSVCSSGYCEDGSCRFGCRSDSDCSGGDVCRTTTSYQNSASGLTWYGLFCVPPCTTVADCPDQVGAGTASCDGGGCVYDGCSDTTCTAENVYGIPVVCG